MTFNFLKLKKKPIPVQLNQALNVLVEAHSFACVTYLVNYF